jgi:hypothetical protein
MHVEDFKTWHWMLAGLFAGLLFSCVRLWQGPAFVSSEADTVAVGEFEHLAYAGTKLGGGGPEWRYVNEYHKGLPLLKDVVVHPPLHGDALHQYWITGRQYWIGTRMVDPTKPGSKEHLMWGWKSFKYAAPTPYVPGYAQRKVQLQDELNRRQDRAKHDTGFRLRMEIANINSEIRQMDDIQKSVGNQNSFPTVIDYLKTVKGMQGSTLTYSFAWYELPAAIWALPPIAGLLMIGIAWPLALGVMQNWGMARPPSVKKPKRVTSPLPKPVVPIAASAGVVFKPVVPAPEAAVESEHAEYRGEFYPVVKSSHKDS